MRVTFVVAIVVVSVLTTGAVAGGLWWAINGGLYGCTPRDQEFGRALAELEVLDVRAPDAEAQDGRYWGCDDDDGFAFAGQRYLSALDRDSVVAFYESEWSRLGWHLQGQSADPVPDEGLVSSAAVLCFSTDVEGATAYLVLWFPSDFGEREDVHGVGVSASHDGAAWC